MGKLISKTYGNGVTETINYNIQGWQTATAVTNGSSNIYSQQLKYYNPTKGSTPLYTGNISEWSTTMGTQAMNTYGFEYDKLGRLKNTLHYIAVATTPTNSYTERGITYDLNGNITTLKRYAASEATPEDDYQYIYTGNKLTQIAGTDNNATISNATYTYDSNGNMRSDGLKNLQISYNFLNLPSVVTQDDTPVAEYSWFADGSKYRVLTQQNNGYIYIGSLIYASNNGNLQIESTNFAGGRINLVENTLTNTFSQDIQYHHKDHLGSVRAITNQNGETVEQNAYYPFGSRHTFGGTYAQTTNRFKFNGKEEQTTGNLNYLDYGARMYDSNIGRWMVQDPLSEKYYAYSQYSFSGNNPILNIDSDGKAWDTFIDAVFLIYDLGSALYNHIIGEHNKAQQNWKDVGIDAASMIIPGVAAPMMKGVKKGVNVAADAVVKPKRTLKETADIGKEAHRQIEYDLEVNRNAKIEYTIKLDDNVTVRKDAQLPDGTLIIIKPDSPSGHKSAKKRETLLNKYGYDKVEVIFYDMNDPRYLPTSKNYIGPKRK